MHHFISAHIYRCRYICEAINRSWSILRILMFSKEIPLKYPVAKTKRRAKQSHLFEKPCGVLADLHEPHDDVVEVDVAERGVILALPPHLVQQQVPAVHWGQQVLVFPETRRVWPSVEPFPSVTQLVNGLPL